MTGNAYKIFKAEKKMVPDVAEVLCDSFTDYPVMRYIIGTEADYKRKLEMLLKFFIMARILRNEVILGIGDSAGIAGAALISNPDKSGDIPELNELREQTWSGLGPHARSRYQRFGEAAAQFVVDAPHLHLNMIGIKQQYQGLGLGRRLIEEVHRLSSAEIYSTGVTLTTEDPANVPFYKYMGYHSIGHAKVAEELETWKFFRPDQVAGYHSDR